MYCNIPQYLGLVGSCEHGVEYDDYCPLRCEAMKSDRKVLTFRRNLLLPSSR
jgi:hypothetical protein